MTFAKLEKLTKEEVATTIAREILTGQLPNGCVCCACRTCKPPSRCEWHQRWPKVYGWVLKWLNRLDG